MSKEITSRSVDFSKWYNDIVVKADLAEHSSVRGCMVIKPYGFAIWEKMKSVLDARFKATGHVNAAFPLLIPKSFLSKEAAHVEGFAKECAVVTHYRLKNAEDGSGVIVDPDAKLEEELIIRPTSETIIWNTYKNWIHSYRDLPLLINQWANVMRWEMRTRLFLRTSEFFWQEGHTAHATRQEAIDEEALQMGTSHFLGQNFAKAFDVKFQTKEGGLEHVWATSWGVSTRLMGALVMAHSDDQGLVVPPKLAPIQVVIVPILGKKMKPKMDLLEETVAKIQAELEGVSVKYDGDDTKRAGFKFAEYELKGIPLRIAVGPRDLDNGTVEIARRDTRTKETYPLDNIGDTVRQLLDDIQQNLYTKALAHQKEHTTKVDTFDEFKEVLNGKGGFIYAHWDGTVETEAAIKEATKATIRCIPLDNEQEEGVCVFSGKPSTQRVLFAKAY